MADQAAFRRDWWTEVEIHAPMTLEACKLCGALIGGWDGLELHWKWHKGREKQPPG